MTQAIAIKGRQGGVALLEALIGILIFSIGILAVVGMQATAIRTVADSKYRSEAAFLANELVAQMWTDAANLGSYAYTGSGGVPAKLDYWINNAKNGVNVRLPGAATVPPIVTVTGASANGAAVQIEVRWQMPEEASQGLPPRKHVIAASIYIN